MMRNIPESTGDFSHQWAFVVGISSSTKSFVDWVETSAAIE